MSNKDHAKFHTDQAIARASSAAAGLDFDDKLKAKIEKHGHGSKIPAEEVGELLGPMSPEFFACMRLYLQMVNFATKLNLEVLDFELAQLLSCKLRGRLDTPEQDEMLVEIMNAPDVRRRTWDKLVSLNDIKHVDIVAVFGTDRHALEEFLNTDPRKLK